MTVLPIRLTLLTLAAWVTTLSPTAAKRPLRIRACETTRLLASIVGIVPLEKARSAAAVVAVCWGCAYNYARPSLHPIVNATAPPTNCRRERPFTPGVSFLATYFLLCKCHCGRNSLSGRTLDRPPGDPGQQQGPENKRDKADSEDEKVGTF